MDPRIGTVIEEWRFRPCDPGYAGLHQLADEGFSGAVTADGARGFMVNGRLIAIEDGTIESFWSSEFTAAEAEDPAIPLLCAMWLAGGEVEAEYYTGDTSISEVDQTLSQGQFTGFIELSENVFSGDYYVVYYGGTSFSVAFVGTDERVVVGEEAFERANEEVGIYEVNSVDIDVIEIPDPEVDESAVQTEPTDPEPEPEPEPEPGEEPEQSTAAETATDQQADTAAEPSEPDETTAVPETTQNGDPDGANAGSQQRAAEPARAATAGRAADEDLASLAAAAEDAGSEGAAPMTVDDLDGRTAGDGELHVIPSLDPQRTTTPQEQPESGAAPGRNGPAASADPEPTSPEDRGDTQPSEPRPSRAADQRISELESKLAEARESRDELAAENERLTERVAELEEEIEDLQAELEAAGGGVSDLAPAQAIAGTNVFVRYRSKADLTLEDALDGGGDADAIRQNLQLEWHTEFDAEGMTIEDQPFEVFLESTAHYRFATWLVSELLFELRETGADAGLPDLYHAIPEIDRIEFDGEVPIQTTEGGDRASTVYAFDVVCRNSMGDPLIVVNLNSSREPVDGPEVSELVTNAHEVANARSSVVAAGYVTNSFYEPDALEAVTSATESGFLRGGSKESFVRVSRKRGFHLCLVESRDESFHLTIPEL